MSTPEISSKAPEYQHTSTVRMTKNQANKLNIGERVAVTIRGAVTGIRQCYDDKDMYDVDLKASTVSGISSTNGADKAYKKLTGEE